MREQTKDLSPEETAAVLKSAKPTIDKIIAGLNEESEDADASYDPPQPNNYSLPKPTKGFDQALTDLTAVVGKAAKSPNGEQIVKDTATQIVNHIIKDDNVGRYDEALGKTIARGGGADLTVEVIRQLKAAGKVDEADDVLQNVEDSIKELKDNIENSLESYAEESEEFQWLVGNWDR